MDRPNNRHLYQHTFPDDSICQVCVDLSDLEIVKINATAYPPKYHKEYCEWRKKIAEKVTDMLTPRQLAYVAKITTDLIKSL